MTRLAQELARVGHSVRVVCALPHYDTNRIWPAYRGKLFQRDQLGKIEITRVWLYVPAEKANLLGRIWNYVTFNILSTLAGLCGPRPDIILAPSPPLTIGLSAWLLGLLRRVPYVYNVQDIYPDVAVRLGALRSRRVIAFFSWMERFVYRHAAAISVISEGFRRNLLAKGVPESKLAVIPNFVDADFIRPGPKDNPLARREGLTDRFVVLFAGNLGMAQGLRQVIQAAELLRDCHGMLFVLAGNGAAKQDLEQEVRRKGLPNVHFLPFLPFEDMPELHGASDLCLIPLRRGIAQESVPSKALTIMAAARPILASVDAASDIAALIETAGCGICLPPEDPAALAEAILTLRDDPERRRAMGARGRAMVCQHFTPEIVARQYDALLSGLARKRTKRPV